MDAFFLYVYVAISLLVFYTIYSYGICSVVALLNNLIDYKKDKTINFIISNWQVLITSTLLDNLETQLS